MKKNIRSIFCLALFPVTFFLFQGLTRYCYNLWLPGVPDSGQVPTPVIPWLFWVYESGPTGLFSCHHMSTVWLLACLCFVIPPFGSMLLSSKFIDRFLCSSFTLVLLGWSITKFWYYRSLGIKLFNRPYTLSKAISASYQGILLLLFLCMGVLVTGYLLNKKFNA